MFTLGGILLGTGSVLAALPVLGFVFAPAMRMVKNKWIDLGSVSQFPVGETRLASYRNPVAVPWDGVTDHIPCWVRHIQDEKFQVFAVHCTHLGCPVKWFQESGLFMCPCHGGVYYEDGSRASGPPPRGLYEYEYKIENGRLIVSGGRLPTLQEPV
jgi:Rieske Fe-S protein